MKEIKITKGKIVLVDDEDFERVNKYQWQAKIDKRTNIIYAQRNVEKNGKITKLMMHTFIMNPPTGLVIDHKDHNGLNNQKFNLRVCTNPQNGKNYRRPKNNTSGYKGVYFNKNAGKFCAKIRQGNKQKHLGLFVDVIEAARAYDIAAKTLFGEYALLNFSE